MNCNFCNNSGYIDNVYIVGDLRQAEALVVAELLKRVGDPTLWNLFQSPTFDIHKWAASDIFQCSEDEITKDQRSVGKLRVHSGNYGAGPNVILNKALKQGIKGIDYQFAKKMIASNHRQLPGLKIWWKDVERKLRQTRSLTTCLGRRRLFFGRLDESTYRDAYSYEPQSTVGDVCNAIFWKLRERFREMDLAGVLNSDSLRPSPLIQVHDEVVTRCPNIPEIVDFTIQAYKEAANIHLNINEDKPLVIPIELKIGKNWKDTEEIE